MSPFKLFSEIALFNVSSKNISDFARKWLTRGYYSFIIKRDDVGEGIMISTDDLLKETGISYPTLTRLKDLGIVPKPSKQGLGNKRGVIGVFPDEVISIINWVKQEQSYGLSLVQIAEKWRQREITEEEVLTTVPNPNKIKWATDLFAELAEKYPNDDFVPGEVIEISDQANGSIVAKVKLVRVPR